MGSVIARIWNYGVQGGGERQMMRFNSFIVHTAANLSFVTDNYCMIGGRLNVA